MTKTIQISPLEAMARDFVKEFIRTYKWLEDLSEKHGISLVVLQGLVKFFEEEPNLRKEGEVLNLGFVIKNDFVNVETPYVIMKKFHFSKWYRLSNLKNSINGQMLCYVIDNKGNVTIGQIPLELMKENARSTMQLISQVWGTITVCIEGSTAFVYSSGSLAQVRRNGKWMKPPKLPFSKVAKDGFPLNLLNHVLKLSTILSEKNRGGIFVIIKETQARYCHSMNQDIAFEKRLIDTIPDYQLINFADLDGALILDINRELLAVGQRLEAPPVDWYYEESGRGTRHNSASQYSRATNSVVFVISEDGPISLYFNGNLIGRCFKQLFGKK